MLSLLEIVITPIAIVFAAVITSFTNHRIALINKSVKLTTSIKRKKSFRILIIGMTIVSGLTFFIGLKYKDCFVETDWEGGWIETQNWYEDGEFGTLSLWKQEGKVIGLGYNAKLQKICVRADYLNGKNIIKGSWFNTKAGEKGIFELKSTNKNTFIGFYEINGKRGDWKWERFNLKELDQIIDIDYKYRE